MSNIKFYKQRKNTTVCVPLAVLNVCKLVGSKATKSSRLYETIKKQVDFAHDYRGGRIENIGPTLRTLKFKVKIRRQPRLKWMENEIRKEGVIVYSGGFVKNGERQCGHVELLIGETPKCFIVVNAKYDVPTVSFQPKKLYIRRPVTQWSHAVVVLLKKVKEEK